MKNVTSFFHEATLRICASLDIKSVAEKCLEYLKAYIPLDGVWMSYYDENDHSIITIALASDIPIHMPNQPIRMSTEAQQTFSLKQRGVIIINNPEQKPAPFEIWEAIGLLDKSSLVLPIWFKDKRLGQVDFFVRGRDKYTVEHLRLIETLSEPFAIAMANALQYQKIINLKELLEVDNKYLRQKLHLAAETTIVGAHGGLRDVMVQVNQVAPLTSQVLLLGKTGTGKELVASAIHNGSQRKNGPFIKVNCGAIPENLIDSELFGHEKGAFTGALQRKLGRFELAHGGTLFLDEVGELPPAVQVRLLRVLQDSTIDRVGGVKARKVDVRIIAATNRNMEQMVQSGRFREDLWFRLNVFPIMIPPLRQRRSDIPDLINHFVTLKSRELNLRRLPVLAPGEMERLQAYDWPGNVRELQNLVERAIIRNCIDTSNKPLRFDIEVFSKSEHARPDKKAGNEPNAPANKVQTLDEIMSRHIKTVLKETGGRIQGKRGAAELLGINPNTLRSRMKKLGIPYGKENLTAVETNPGDTP